MMFKSERRGKNVVIYEKTGPLTSQSLLCLKTLKGDIYSWAKDRKSSGAN
jgi:hypothetical protein